ncbi:hypothetical protein WJX73_005962 [Symbiochloris irregularis]|uniref:Strictosidine synthase conserved region domain-containing protein n=1 Tax=Symbiochloris irregularis TaxID=706552 RepID=A0AAW1NQK2_9CHLO
MQARVILSTAVVAGVLALFTGALSGPELRLPYPSLEAIQPVQKKLLPNVAPLEGVFAPNDILKNAVRLFDGVVEGSETVAPLTHLGAGRPLGFELDDHGNLIVCNAGVGLQMVEKDTWKVVLLASHAPAADGAGRLEAIRYANDLIIGPNGTIYFTDSQNFGPVLNKAGFFDTLDACMLGLLQGRPSGKVLAYDPSTKATHLLADGIWFANGIALSSAGDFLAVVETGSLHVYRLWLTGPQAGTRDILISSLPGFPDGISLSEDGHGFWVSVVMPKNILAKALPLPRWARFLIGWIPASLRPKPHRFGCIVQVSEEGKVLRMLMDPDGQNVATVAAVSETGTQLFVGNLAGNYVSVLDKKFLPPILKRLILSDPSRRALVSHRRLQEAACGRDQLNGSALATDPVSQPAAVPQIAERPIEMVSQESKPSSVGQRKAFFEAMIRSNSDTFISARHPGSPSTSAAVAFAQTKPIPCRTNESLFASDSADQDYNEVQLTFRMPRHDVASSVPASSLSSPQPGRAPLPSSAFSQNQARSSAQPAQSEIIAALQLELQQKERQWKADASRLQRKSQEVENLTRVVSELTQGRSKLVEEDLRSQNRLVAYLKEHSGRLRVDNLELNERIRLLERLPMFKYGRESACMLEFTAYKIRETY